MPPRRRGTAWTLTRAECEKRRPPHRRREIVRDTRGDSVRCLLCGATLEKNGRPVARRRAPGTGGAMLTRAPATGR